MKKDVVASVADKNEIVIYQPEGGEFHIAVRVEKDSVWLTQAQMAELFHATKQNISHHVAKIFKEGELDPKVVVKEYLTTTSHGAICGKTQIHAVKNYNLDVIISVGYRIKSIQGTRFRQWANQVLRDHLLKGYSLNQRMPATKSRPSCRWKISRDIARCSRSCCKMNRQKAAMNLIETGNPLILISPNNRETGTREI